MSEAARVMGTLSSLAILVGRWSTQITMLHPPDQQNKTFDAQDTYRWLAGENILIHEVSANMAGTDVNSIEIFSSDAARQITSCSFDSGGDVSNFKILLENDDWEIIGDTQRFKSTSFKPDEIKGLWQLKTEDCWTDWMSVVLKRQG
jgi:hypothetical protein